MLSDNYCNIRIVCTYLQQTENFGEGGGDYKHALVGSVCGIPDKYGSKRMGVYFAVAGAVHGRKINSLAACNLDYFCVLFVAASIAIDLMRAKLFKIARIDRLLALPDRLLRKKMKVN